MFVDIDTGPLRRHTETLKRLHRSALPVAIREALTSAAFDVKQKTMPQTSKDAFTERKPTFFKANSKVIPAKGFDINVMKSEVGFTPKSGNDKSVDDLEQQEHGGDIDGRALIPLKQARAGGSWNKNVRAKDRVTATNNVVKSSRARGRTAKERFQKSAIHAGKGGVVIGNRNGAGGQIAFRINSVKRVKKDTIVRAKPLFSVKKGRKVPVRATHFMVRASETSARKMAQFYVTAANKQIQKSMRR